MCIPEVKGNSFKLSKNILLYGTLEVYRNYIVVLLNNYVDDFLCLLGGDGDCWLGKRGGKGGFDSDWLDGFSDSSSYRLSYWC